MAQSVLSGITEIERIIADLLDYARETQLDYQEYPLSLILAPVVTTATAEADQRGVQVLTSGLGQDVLATVDGPRLRQVFANVMKNALEATERHAQGVVKVRLYQRQSSAVVEVADNGVGIDPTQRDKIFLPFFTTKPSGTGLGMAVVKKIMDLHGGEIEIDSWPGEGTTVRLVIPRAARPTAVKAG
jgi:two-component system, NtrC family, sensor histidine kinase HydH